VFVSRRGSDCGRSRLPFWLRVIASYQSAAHARMVFAMSSHAPLHFFEIIFYSTASLLAVIGLAWYFF
jgi:hypothetical protein